MITYTNIPRYLSDNIEHTQRRALSIILPDLKYREALIETDLEPLYERREKLCKKLFTSIENDSYHKIHGLLPPLNITTLCTDQIETSTSPPPRANLGHLTISCARGVGNLTFTWVGWGKLN